MEASTEMAAAGATEMEAAAMSARMGGAALMGLSPEAQQLLEQAQQALAAGDPRRALNLAQRSYREDRSPLAREMMGRAHCKMRDLGAANAMARSLPRGAYRRLARYCQSQGITLAPR